MADIGTILKKVRRPLRMMGAKSTELDGSVLYFEYGTFTIANGATTGTLPTGLTNVVWAGFFPLNVYGRTANPYSDLTLTSSKITVNNTDPANAAGGQIAYLLVGTVETL